VVNRDLVRAVEEKIQEKRRSTISSLSLHFSQIVSDKLRFQKLCSHWVPKMLMEEHKIKRQANVLTFLTRYNEQGDEFLSRTVTGDETWVSHVIPKSKQQSMEYRYTTLSIKKKFKQTISIRKIMCTVFWGRKCILFGEFLPQGSIINAGVYCDS
jgi:hypothetical protein